PRWTSRAPLPTVHWGEGAVAALGDLVAGAFASAGDFENSILSAVRTYVTTHPQSALVTHSSTSTGKRSMSGNAGAGALDTAATSSRKAHRRSKINPFRIRKNNNTMATAPEMSPSTQQTLYKRYQGLGPLIVCQTNC